MANSVFTIYIDDTSIRILVCKGRQVKRWADFPLEPGLIEGAVVTEETYVAGKIKEFLESHEIRAKKVIVGLSGLLCLTRPLTLPKVPKSMLSEAVNREAERQLPVAIDDLYTSYQIISESDSETRVFLVATRRKATDALLKTLKQAGLDPYLLDLKPLVLARIVTKPTAIIVDIQPAEFDIVIMRDGIPQPVRSIPIPDKTLPWQENFNKLREDLDRTIRFYNSNNPENQLSSEVPIYISGEPSRDPELCQAISSEFGHPALPLQSSLKYPRQFDPSRYMVNIGLALKELGGDTGLLAANLNLLPDSYRPKPVSWGRVITVPAAVCLVGLLVPMVMLTRNTSANIDSVRSQLEMTNNLIVQKQAEKQALTKEIAGLEAKLVEAGVSRDAFREALDSLDLQRKTVNEDLQTSTWAAENTVNLLSISHAGGILTINGAASSEAEVLAYAYKLDSSGSFSETTISSMKRDEVTGMEFTLILRVRE